MTNEERIKKIGLKKSGVLSLERISGRHLCRIATKLSQLSVAQQAKFSERGGNSRQSGVESEAILNKYSLACYVNNSTLYTLPSKLKRAFTLAEVLITLGIIGVVAAMTMPTLVAKYQEKATVTKLKKVYSLLSQAYNQIVNDNGGKIIGDERDALKLMESFGKYIKYTKVCGYGNGCFPDVMYKSSKGNDYVNREQQDKLEGNARAILADGTSILWNTTGSHAFSDDRILGQIVVDINGFKGPNQLGKDSFYFYMSPTNILPAGDKRTDVLFNVAEGTYLDIGCLEDYGYACTAWVIYNENMDYLKCPDDLSWNGKTKCD